MIRLYSNENLSLGLVNQLRQLGYNVLTSYDAGRANQRITDLSVLKDATANGRCVITFNRDDFIKLHLSGIEHRGIIICKEDRDQIGQAAIIHDFLTDQKTLNNRLIRILEQNQPGLKQPQFTVREYYHS
ncbi:DUF5615 family PIN-like protein [Synechocystis sp. FACHB-383]|uniref:DUF5615 family PIN-like protein n=1 Tax=Synechocystis sp. FACHB-383 TaxID=2692864 RepID=UPI0016883FBA|nr:DUF5615 family PIN-like protein [Synechocystis sp. FACHB-383]MBD2652395.1 DUF5615 family PIN-like protein [Synechocystis sp. FACHB-383]